MTSPEVRKPTRLSEIRRRAIKAKDTIFHPKRTKERKEIERQEVLGEIYSHAYTTLRDGNFQFIPANEGWGINQIRVDYLTPKSSHIVIATNDVTVLTEDGVDIGVLPLKPAEIDLAFPGITPYPNQSLTISVNEEGKYNIERHHWDGPIDDRFKFTADEGRRIKKVLFDEALPTAKRWIRTK